MSSPATRNVALDRIQIDPSLQARTQLDADTVTRYEATLRQSIEDGVAWPFPPLVSVFDLLVDGFHRFEAAKRVGIASIPVTIHSGDHKDAIRLAVGANANHGLARSREDVKRAILLASKTWPDESSRSIARMVGCSPQTVLNVQSRHRQDDTPTKVDPRLSKLDTEPFADENGNFIPRVPPAAEQAIIDQLETLGNGSGLIQCSTDSDDFTLVIRTEDGYHIRQMMDGRLNYTSEPIWARCRTAWFVGPNNPGLYCPLTTEPLELFADATAFLDVDAMLCD